MSKLLFHSWTKDQSERNKLIEKPTVAQLRTELFAWILVVWTTIVFSIGLLIGGHYCE